jgi:hypothetical protein
VATTGARSGPTPLRRESERETWQVAWLASVGTRMEATVPLLVSTAPGQVEPSEPGTMLYMPETAPTATVVL